MKISGKRVNIIAQAEFTGLTTLRVTEEGRNHRFNILFKKDIDFGNASELIYDYSTEKKLEQHIRETALRRSPKPGKTVVNVSSKAEPVDNSSIYNKLLEKGEEDLKQENLEDAKSSFDMAHILRPQDVIPIQRLGEIKIRLAAKEKTGQSKNGNDYSTIIAGAINYLGQKKYAQAQEAYKQALSLRPGDLYATRQLETINGLLLEEKSQKEQQNFKGSYDEYISQGEKAYSKNQFKDAKMAFEQALITRQNDFLATSRLKLINEKEKHQKEIEELENNYKTLIQLADKYYNEGDYSNARINYNKAIDLIKRLYPQDQVKKIDKILAEQISKEKIEKQKQAQQLLADNKEKEKQALEDNYDTAVQLAGKYYKQGDYEDAKKAYNRALGFIKKDFPRERIIEINKILASQAAGQNTERQEKERQDLKNKYNTAMESADKFFDAGDYANAKIEYNKAMTIIPDSLPREQIKKINKIMTAQLIESVTEMQRQAQEADITSRYASLLKNADMEFNKTNYIKAKKLYADASGLKPVEEYPKERLSAIENYLAKITSGNKTKKDSISQTTEISRKYNQALLKGKSYYQKNDFLNAKSFYEEALNLKPSEEEPKKQLDIIIEKLAEIARMDEINNYYESKIALADSLLNEKAYESALTTYKEASGIKPVESYPGLQIKYIKSAIIEDKKLKQTRKRQDDERMYIDALAGAEKAVADKRYRDAKYYYFEALSVHPENTYAQSRLKIVSYQVERARADKLKQLPVKIVEQAPPVIKAKRKSRKNKLMPVIDSMVFQDTPIPYNNEELKSKYPNIDFLAFPPGQSFNKSLVYSNENIHAFDTMLLKKPGLDSSSSDQGIKLTCQGINFGETIVYFKFLIQNYSKTDFLTGPMMLTWTKRNGDLVKLYPYYLIPANLPLIKPSKQANLIYVCKSNDILDEETLNFELTDRFNKIKLLIKIPGSAYNEEWAR
ncbi:MAG: hypothetical protein ABI760_00675 [Ferruginibacter sp.]